MGMAFDSAPFNEDIHMCEEFIKLRDKYGIKTVVETGTYKGMTTKWFGENFGRVFTTEIIEGYHNEAKQYIGNMPHVHCVLGDVEAVLPGILAQCDNSMIFFEDCHWYKNPVVGELQLLKVSGLKPILVLHDMKNPNHPDFGYDTYPDQGIVYEWDWIKPQVDAIYGEGKYRQYWNDKATGAKRGAIFIIPEHMYVNESSDQKSESINHREVAEKTANAIVGVNIARSYAKAAPKSKKSKKSSKTIAKLKKRVPNQTPRKVKKTGKLKGLKTVAGLKKLKAVRGLNKLNKSK